MSARSRPVRLPVVMIDGEQVSRRGRSQKKKKRRQVEQSKHCHVHDIGLNAPSASLSAELALTKSHCDLSTTAQPLTSKSLLSHNTVPVPNRNTINQVVGLNRRK
jgi:hypothetical protein